nr:hypothetical protein [Tanacetum cinerariifolium]
KERELKYLDIIRNLEYYNESYKECIETLKKKLETLQHEKEGVDGKLAGLLTVSKDLDNLIESQRSDKNKEGLGYNVVPPQITQIYSPPKKDLSWTGLPEFADDIVTDYSRPSPTVESTLGDDQNRNSSAFKNGESTDSILSKPTVKFVKAAERTCFNCGHFNHLAYDCGLGVKKGRTCPTYTHKIMPPRKSTHRPYRPPMRPNMNFVRPNKPAHSYGRRPFQETIQELMIILIQRVQRLERELKARTLVHKVDRGRSKPVMAWVLKKD